MFKKFVSNIPFNPSLINQISFYSKRLRQENSIRQTGFILITLTFLLQIFAITLPPKTTVARPGNDIVPGGFTTQAQAVQLCQSNTYNFGTILRNYGGMTCKTLEDGHIETIKSTDQNRQLYSMGRLPYGKPGEVAVEVAGAGTLFMRPLWSWDTGSASTYQAIVSKNIFGIPYMVLFSCGNLVVIGAPPQPSAEVIKPPAPNPAPNPTPTPIQPIIPKKTTPDPETCPMDSSILKTNPRCKVCPYNNSLLEDNKSCKPCDKANNQSDNLACITLSKLATNTTLNITDANNTTAKPNDVIQYLLTAKNTGSGTIKEFLVQDNLTDTLEYADVVDLHGGQINQNNVVSWPTVNIESGQNVQKFITIKIKNTLPNTSSPLSNPGSFDLVINNVYGNATNIKLEADIVKSVESITTTTLPNTGPGISLVVSFITVAFTGYFFARSRLMKKELDIIRQDYASSGGN